MCFFQNRIAVRVLIINVKKRCQDLDTAALNGRCYTNTVKLRETDFFAVWIQSTDTVNPARKKTLM